jgi:hypothetical protein
MAYPSFSELPAHPAVITAAIATVNNPAITLFFIVSFSFSFLLLPLSGEKIIRADNKKPPQTLRLETVIYTSIYIIAVPLKLTKCPLSHVLTYTPD